jgi:hypothetical protein
MTTDGRFAPPLPWQTAPDADNAVPLQKTKRGFDPGFDLPVLDQTDFARAVERENWRERVVVISAARKPHCGPYCIGGHDWLAGRSASLPDMM